MVVATVHGTKSPCSQGEASIIEIISLLFRSLVYILLGQVHLGHVTTTCEIIPPGSPNMLSSSD